MSSIETQAAGQRRSVANNIEDAYLIMQYYWYVWLENPPSLFPVANGGLVPRCAA